jgi:hypothetical protein
MGLQPWYRFQVADQRALNLQCGFAQDKALLAPAPWNALTLQYTYLSMPPFANTFPMMGL